ncbi:MAG: transposase [Planctomycetes bacterium]|nr:transposase [Planctomycetota bacterium]
MRKIFVRSYFASQRRQARELGIVEPRPATMVAAQFFDSALRLDPHFHALFADGVCVVSSAHDRATFHPRPAPTDEQLARVTARIDRRVRALLRDRGLLQDDGGGLQLDGERHPLVVVVPGLPRPVRAQRDDAERQPRVAARRRSSPSTTEPVTSRSRAATSSRPSPTASSRTTTSRTSTGTVIPTSSSATSAAGRPRRAGSAATSTARDRSTPPPRRAPEHVGPSELRGPTQGLAVPALAAREATTPRSARSARSDSILRRSSCGPRPSRSTRAARR